MNNKYLSDEEAQEKLQRLDYLKNRKKELETKIAQLDEDDFFKMTISQKGARNRVSLYRKVPVSWIDSVYCTKRDSILRHITSSLSNFDIKDDVRRMKEEAQFEQYSEIQYYALLCESVIHNNESVILILSDPYRKVKSQPLYKIDKKIADSWIGSILICKAKLSPYQMESDVLEILTIKHTRYTKYGIIKDNKEQNFCSPLKEFLPDINYNAINDLSFLMREAYKKGWIAYKYCAENVVFYKENTVVEMIIHSNTIECIYDFDAKIDEKTKKMLKAYREGRNADFPEILDSRFQHLICTECFCH